MPATYGFEIGEILARIHALDVEWTDVATEEPTARDWPELAEQARVTGQPWADELASRVSTFLAIAEFVDGCERPGPVVLTHKAIQPWNLLARDGRPVLLDWELSGMLDLPGGARLDRAQPRQGTWLRRHRARHLPLGPRVATPVTAMFCLVADDSENVPGDPSEAWLDLAPDYERARTREDSLDRLVEWPAQRALLGDVTGHSLLDLGCGNGNKLAELVGEGATASVGIDVSGNFLSTPPPGLELIQGDLSELDSIPGLVGRTFDRILFLQSFGYAKNPLRTLQAARAMLADDGFILLTKTQPIRYAVERAEQNGTSLGEEYFSTVPFSYTSGWNDQIALTKRPYTISDLINVFSAAGLWIETALEPQLSEDAR
ncbi:methyltransferase domain-containing protein, partial [Kribbella sp.]|uniref:methyltransferase domain-containing protein n=1 Tax=Kribbella sp. TaxID=1871183 RepID=UPI002D74CBB8